MAKSGLREEIAGAMKDLRVRGESAAAFWPGGFPDP